ncbi:tetratricopeptide repeat protein [Thiothrix nivea]|uniref:Tetratricopeptide repeat protein n=1 Tax=Thiothrix nivea (strain ATCC 35100 / DSM 5205 / JP2) TaxID=870187 RepID=A0A656HEB8_THINJ|nr:hypothetical protein [Thiothrix nivea]EIJ35441.1 hypothetical protein Thini_2910 [Thiothrix nivea DSM 5205]
MKRNLLILIFLAFSPTKLLMADNVSPTLEASDSFPLGSWDNPVKCNSPSGEREYLSRLRCSSGDMVDFERLGNSGEGVFGNIVDDYELRCINSKKTVHVYMDMYHDYRESQPIDGFSIISDEWGKEISSALDLLESKKYNEALHVSEKAVEELPPDNIIDDRKYVTYYLIGMIHMNERIFHKAQVAFLKSVTLQESFPSKKDERFYEKVIIFYSLALAYDNKSKEALSILERKINPCSSKKESLCNALKSEKKLIPSLESLINEY